MAQPDTQRHTLLEARREVSVAIRASEEWQPSYKAHPETFKALLKHEAELEEQVSEYLAGLAERAPTYVDWTVYSGKLNASADGDLNATDAVWKQEQINFTKAVVDAIELLIATGGQAGELEYGIALGITSLTDSVTKAARDQVAELVSGVFDTNRKLIREAIRSSLTRGETLQDAAERIKKVINNPVRAEMIAQTESVNAYQTGLKNFGLASGAKRKTWESLAGACKVCAPLDGETVDIDEMFSNGKDKPSAHPRCRCGIYLEY
ncbi:phage minor head protein [Rhodococcoides kyotonense]|uniref:Phage Mu protein F like protein n=1 Tax=Rhodococcoides kyotonense TaxID=398843 RepID=A0A239MVA6_9NOCA|nr:phage minor head protein [Rhodococcus kyotonensis]SNT46717.1 Phage Mu protein F like protein [Rhodococcus kyotonensis]